MATNNLFLEYVVKEISILHGIQKFMLSSNTNITWSDFQPHFLPYRQLISNFTFLCKKRTQSTLVVSYKNTFYNTYHVKYRYIMFWKQFRSWSDGFSQKPADQDPHCFPFSLYFCLFDWFDSLRPINNLSAKQGRVFLGWTSNKLG